MGIGGMPMSKPNFKTMNLKQLRTYILSHRDDDDAFHTFVDRVDNEKSWTTHPPINSIEEMEKYPEILEKFKQDSGRKVL